MATSPRGLGPPFLHDREGRDTASRSAFLSQRQPQQEIHRARSVAAARPGRSSGRFAAISDVVVENFKVENAHADYALDYESIRKINPSVVYCSITGFGQTGPYSHRPGYDTLFQAMGGVMSVTGGRTAHPAAGR